MQTDEERASKHSIAALGRRPVRARHVKPLRSKRETLGKRCDESSKGTNYGLDSRFDSETGYLDKENSSEFVSPRSKHVVFKESYSTGNVIDSQDRYIIGAPISFKKRGDKINQSCYRNVKPGVKGGIESRLIETSEVERADIHQRLSPTRCHTDTDNIDCAWKRADTATEETRNIVGQLKEFHSRLTLSSGNSRNRELTGDACCKNESGISDSNEREALKHSRLSFNKNDELRDNGLRIKSATDVTRKRHRTSSFSGHLEKGVDQKYVPSWLQVDAYTMDRRARPSKGSLGLEQGPGKKSWSISDLRDIDAIQTHPNSKVSNKIHDTINSRSHENIEQEYLKLRKQIQTHSESQPVESFASKSVTAVRNSTLSTPNGGAPVNGTSLEKRGDLFESDELGMNHFMKHIQNVKQTSRKYRRHRKQTEQSQKPNKRKLQSMFIPIYEN